MQANDDVSPADSDSRSDDCLLRVTHSDVTRVISDIDDTCKHSKFEVFDSIECILMSKQRMYWVAFATSSGMCLHCLMTESM